MYIHKATGYEAAAYIRLLILVPREPVLLAALPFQQPLSPRAGFLRFRGSPALQPFKKRIRQYFFNSVRGGRAAPAACLSPVSFIEAQTTVLLDPALMPSQHFCDILIAWARPLCKTPWCYHSFFLSWGAVNKKTCNS